MNYTVIKITINNFYNLKVKGELQMVWYYESCILCAWNDIRDSTLWICFTFALLLVVIFTLGRPSTLTPEDGDTRVGLSQSKKCTVWTRRRLVAEATRRSSDLILKESFLSQLLFPTMHEMVNDGQDVLCFCRYPRNLIIIIFFIPSLFPREDAGEVENASSVSPACRKRQLKGRCVGITV